MKITFTSYDATYSVETKSDDYDSRELKEIFSRILVASGFPPSVIDATDDGSFQYVAEDEIIIKREENVD